MSTYLTYYLQTNIVCIMFLIYILVSNRIDKKDLTVDARLLEQFVFEVFAYCVVDVVAAVMKSQTFAGARLTSTALKRLTTASDIWKETGH